MDASLQVEPQLQLLVHQPARAMDAIVRCDDRVDPEASEDHEDRENGNDLPLKIRHVLSALSGPASDYWLLGYWLARSPAGSPNGSWPLLLPSGPLATSVR